MCFLATRHTAVTLRIAYAVHRCDAQLTQHSHVHSPPWSLVCLHCRALVQAYRHGQSRAARGGGGRRGAGFGGGGCGTRGTARQAHSQVAPQARPRGASSTWRLKHVSPQAQPRSPHDLATSDSLGLFRLIRLIRARQGSSGLIRAHQGSSGLIRPLQTR